MTNEAPKLSELVRTHRKQLTFFCRNLQEPRRWLDRIVTCELSKNSRCVRLIVNGTGYIYSVDEIDEIWEIVDEAE